MNQSGHIAVLFFFFFFFGEFLFVVVLVFVFCFVFVVFNKRISFGYRSTYVFVVAKTTFMTD